MKLKGINLNAAKALRRVDMLSSGINLSTRVAHTELSKKNAKKDRKNWRKNMGKLLREE